MNCKTVYSKSITCDSINFQAALAQLLIKPSHISRRFTYDKHMGPSRRIGDPNRRTAWEWALLDHYSDRRAPTPHSPLTWKGAISIEVGWSRHLITDPHFKSHALYDKNETKIWFKNNEGDVNFSGYGRTIGFYSWYLVFLLIRKSYVKTLWARKEAQNYIVSYTHRVINCIEMKTNVHL